MPRGRKAAATTANTSPEKPTPARRGRRAKEVDEIPLHLLKASDESSENSDNDSDYGSPKKGAGRGGRGGGAGRGRGRKPKEAPVEVTPVARLRRGRRGAAAKEPSPDIEQAAAAEEQVDDHSQSTQEYSESTQSEQPFESAHEHTNVVESCPAKVSEVSIEQDLHSNDQGPVHEQEEEEDESVVETARDENDVDECAGEEAGEREPEPAMAADDVVEVNEVMQIDDSSEESNQAPPPIVQAAVEAVEEPPKIVETPPRPARERITFADKPPPAEEVAQVVEVAVETRRSPTKASYRYPHMDAPMRSRSSSGEIHEEAPAKPAEEPAEEPKKAVVDEKQPQSSTTTTSTRKRKWGPRKNDEDPVIAITTDSLKTIIADEVKPVPLSDVKLLSPSPEREPEEKRQRVKLTAEDKDAKKKLLKERLRKQEEEEERRNEQLVKAIDKQVASASSAAAASNGASIFKDRKISIITEAESGAVAPSPAKNESSNILYITNLVRPFTVLQLKSLLARTGKIVENGFWIDKIKSKCYVKYETEDEAVETRHALHGVTWPQSNPKCLNVDFGREEDMEKSILSTLEEPRITITTENRDVLEKDFGWTKDPHKSSRDDERKSSRPVREWDVGKNDKDDFDRERNRGRRSADRENRRERERDRSDRDKDDKKEERPDNRRSVSDSPGRKVEGDSQPVRLLDDLFRKTKALPSIYWLPLNAEQIAEKEAQRQKNLAEHNRNIEEMKSRFDRDKRRSVSRDRDQRRRRSRSRSVDRRRRRSISRDRRDRYRR